MSVTPRFPVRMAHMNILLGPAGEAVGLYRLRTASYRFLPVSGKWRLQGQLEALASAIGADFSLWRVCRGYPAEGYIADAAGLLDREHGDPERWQRLLAGHQQRLDELACHQPEVYLAVSLEPHKQPVGLGAGLIRAGDQISDGLRGAFHLYRRRAISSARLRQLAGAEQRTLERLSTLLSGVRRARTAEIQWLIARATCRGIGEPNIDPHWTPQTLQIDTQDGSGAFEPVEQVLYRLANAPVSEHKRHLSIDSEQGESHQAMLAVGGLPDAPPFPGAAAELLFAPLEGCGFAVDAVLHAQWVGNRQALGEVRKRIADVENAYSEQLGAAHGPSLLAGQDRVLAREYEAQLESGARPAMLYATFSLALGTRDEAELERRVDVLRDQYGDTLLHRPAGLQAALWGEHLLRADGGRVGDYRQQMTVEQFGAMVATGTHAVGSKGGVYIGYTPLGVSRPVRYDPTAPSRENRASTVLLAGTLGSGKTIAAELIAHDAVPRGSRVIDIDPKPDHAFEHVPGLDGLVEVVELSGAPGQQGRLDPLLIGIEDLREELAVSYLLELLRAPPASWENAIGRAVKQAAQERARSCMRVVELLLGSDDPAAQEAGKALEVVCDLGLARLGFATATTAQEEHQSRAGVLSIRTPGLVLPDPAAARKTYTRQERISSATLSLLAAYVIKLISSDRHLHKVVLLDEAHSFLTTRQGATVVKRLVKMGRACNTTVLLATQLIGELGELVDLIGTWFIFGQDSDAEAKRALELLGLDSQDEALVAMLRQARTGHGLMRDLDGRVGEIQTDPVDPALLAALTTTPQTAGGSA